jgi:hypothetical protein
VSADELYQAAFDAWRNVAFLVWVSLLDQEQVQFATSAGPEKLIVTGFQWTDDHSEAAAIAGKYREQIKLKRDEWNKKGYATAASPASKIDDDSIPLVSVMPDGAFEWIKSLHVGCGVSSK